MSVLVTRSTNVGPMVYDKHAKDVADAVIAELSEQRETRGVTYKDLVEETGLSRSHLDRLLKGKAAMEIGELVLICDALGVSPFVVMRNARTRVEGRQ